MQTDCLALLSKILKNRLAATGLVLIALLTLTALFSPTLSWLGLIQQPVRQAQGGLDEDGMPLAPNTSHWLGTDNLGRDVFSRVLHGTHVSLIVGVAAMLTATIFGLVIGLIAGFFGG